MPGKQDRYGGAAAHGRRIVADVEKGLVPTGVLKPVNSLGRKVGEGALNLATRPKASGTTTKIGGALASAAAKNPTAVGAGTLAAGGVTAAAARPRRNNYAKRARTFDPHDVRQRELGAASALSGAGGVGGLAYAGHQARRETAANRKLASFSENSAVSPNAKGAKADAARRAARRAHLRRVSISRRGLVAGGLGAVGLAGATSLSRYAASERNGRYT